MITIGPGGSSGKRSHTHPWHQFAIVFEGGVRLTLGTKVQALRRGDTVTLSPQTPHRWENRARIPTRLVIVSSRSSC
ncbi:MAG: cupin domain-containing protein [Candidatus Rokuibacteriota bacterium]